MSSSASTRLGPVFRAEPHDTARHLAEYVSLDAEVGFISDHRDVLSVLRHALAGMAPAVRSTASPLPTCWVLPLPEVPEEIPVIHFSDALELVGAPPDEPDLAPAHERTLGQWAAETYDSEFVAVEGYPMRQRPFYTHPQPGDGRWSNSFDLLFRGLELVTGSGCTGARITWRLSRARSSPQPTRTTWKPSRTACRQQAARDPAERWTGVLTQSENIREVTLFPRDLHRLTP